MKPKNFVVDRDLYEFYLMYPYREIDIKLCQIYTKTHMYVIWYLNQSLNR